MPNHINVFMSLKPVEQIKRFLHISGPENHIPGDEAYYDKVRLLMEHVQEVSKRCYVPSTNFAVDEMIVRFGEQSHHTFQIKNKPRQLVTRFWPSVTMATPTHFFQSHALKRMARLTVSPSIRMTRTCQQQHGKYYTSFSSSQSVGAISFSTCIWTTTSPQFPYSIGYGEILSALALLFVRTHPSSQTRYSCYGKLSWPGTRSMRQ